MSALATSILVFNERVKATASLLNTLAAAIMVFGLIRPLFDGGIVGLRDAIAALVSVASGLALHIYARWSLRRLKEEDVE